METGDEGTFRALPAVDDEVFNFIINTPSSLLEQYTKLARDPRKILDRIDADLNGLARANANLASLVQGTVDGLYAVFADEIGSEKNRLELRIYSFIGVFLILRALDLQLRKASANDERKRGKRQKGQ